MTNDFFKRWKQHNKILKGGAKYTSKYENWTPLCIIDGFETKREAMQCEWRLKRAKGYYKRLKYLSQILQKNTKWTKNSPLISSQNLSIYVTDHFKHLFPFETKELVWF
tara:strand:+ start:109 stop:435 length:327 start_codon:yes stop_codon:yes gene_type:complete